MLFGKKPQPPAQPAAEPVAPPPVAAAAPPIPAAAPVSTARAAQAAPGPGISPEEAKKRAAMAKHIAASFGEIVTLLMRSPAERGHTLKDLEWMVAPALMTGQYAVADAQSKENGAVMPVAAVLWAFVSPAVDQRLSVMADQAVVLAPNEWRSGDIPWVVLALGDTKIVGGLLQQLSKTVFKDKSAKIRARGPDGKMVVGRLEISANPPS